MNKVSLKKMSNKFNFGLYIILFAIFFIVSPVQAQTLTANQIKNDISVLFENHYKKTTEGDIQVKIIATQFSEIQLPDGKITYKISGGGDKILPRDVKRVDIYVDGIYKKTLNLPAQTHVYRDVLVASDQIDREQVLTKECTEVKKVDVSMRADYVLTDVMLNKEITTRKIFQKGEIIDKRFVKMRPDISRNADVRVFFVSGGAVMISIDGTAMGEGMIGDYINVENKNYKKVYHGKIIGENRVLVNI